MRRLLTILTAVVAAAGLLLSIAVHVSTFLGVDPQQVSRLWLLHVGAIALGVPAILSARRAHGEPENGSFAGLFPKAPRWMIVATGSVLVYAVLTGVFQFSRAAFPGAPSGSTTAASPCPTRGSSSGRSLKPSFIAAAPMKRVFSRHGGSRCTASG